MVFRAGRRTDVGLLLGEMLPFYATIFIWLGTAPLRSVQKSHLRRRVAASPPAVARRNPRIEAVTVTPARPSGHLNAVTAIGQGADKIAAFLLK
jgi:hypothetical protein